MSSLVVWLIVGGSIGWLASVMLRTDGQQGILINIVAAIVGAYVGGSLFAPALHFDKTAGYVVAVLSSVLVLVIVNMILRSLTR